MADPLSTLPPMLMDTIKVSIEDIMNEATAKKHRDARLQEQNRKEHEEKQRTPILTLSDGNCGLNAFALKFAELASFDKDGNNKDKLDKIFPDADKFNIFKGHLLLSLPTLQEKAAHPIVKKLIDLLNSASKPFTLDQFKSYLKAINNNQNSQQKRADLHGIQLALAPALRSYLVESMSAKRADELRNSSKHVDETELGLLASKLNMKLYVSEVKKNKPGKYAQITINSSVKEDALPIYIHHTPKSIENSGISAKIVRKGVLNNSDISANPKDGHWSLAVDIEEAESVQYWQNIQIANKKHPLLDGLSLEINRLANNCIDLLADTSF
ncbi:MAG: hypothetical protein ACK4PR_00815, partial [Gammaproteobacteria bacterium]